MVFQLIREEGFSYRQVGELLDISERTVEVHLKLAIEALRQRINQYISEGQAKE
jgi:RNA polymerase sigma-70 factor (ECF subfamily)